MKYPKKIGHWIGDKEIISAGKFFDKENPATGEIIGRVARGKEGDVKKAIRVAENSQKMWGVTPVIKRADLICEIVFKMKERKKELAEIISLELGKSFKSALAEVDAAAECGFFFAGEGRRFFGEILQSANENKHVELIRVPSGVGAIITSFNNPAAGIAWKAFPAFLSGDAVILKSHEYTPYTGIFMAKIFKEAGLPEGVFSVLQGFGPEVVIPLVSDKRVKFASLTGSVRTGREIIKASAQNLTKISIESGGKNPLIVCDDADLEKASEAAAASAFIDAGQRCAAASRIIVFESVYDKFKKIFLDKISRLKIGKKDEDDYGAIISKKRFDEILKDIETAKKSGKILCGGAPLGKRGYFISPTVFENIYPDSEISKKEIFGPVTFLYSAKNFKDALKIANNSDYKLAGSIHTSNIHRANEFIRNFEAGVARVNGPTHGSEPHMPFGGVGLSGNGWREPGTKALDFYSEWKQISIETNSTR